MPSFSQPIAHAPAALWFLFWGLFLVVSTIDYYAVTHRRTAVGVGTALRWTAIWIVVALGFAAAIYVLHPRGSTLYVDYVTGYLTEYSLSVDNLFVFILIFSLMGVQDIAQPKLIKLGIYLSIALRILFILFGIALVERFHWLLYLFGVMLLWTAWKMLMADEEDRIDPANNVLHRAATRLLPVHDAPQEGRALFSRLNGRLCVTPLFLVFLVIGSTDVLFAIDSIPAIMGISQDPFVVLTSNVFAVLGLNSLFFALRGLMGLFRFLKHGVSLILFFIGSRMIAAMYGPLERWFQGRSQVSLAVIGTILVSSIAVSVWHARLHPSGSASD